MSTGKELELGDYFVYRGVEPPILLIYISILANPRTGVGAGFLYKNDEDNWVIQANTAGSTPMEMIDDIKGKLGVEEICAAMRRGGWREEAIEAFVRQM